MKVMTTLLTPTARGGSKVEDLLKFARSNFDTKLIDMDDAEVVSAFRTEVQLLNRKYANTRRYYVSHSYLKNDPRRQVVEVSTSQGKVLTVAFLDMDSDKDMVSPIDLCYVCRTSTTTT